MILSLISSYSLSQQWQTIFAILLVAFPLQIQAEITLEVQNVVPDETVNNFSWCNNLIDALSEGALTLGTFAVCSAAMTLHKRFKDAPAPIRAKSNRAETEESDSIAKQLVMSRPAFPQHSKSAPAHVISRVPTCERKIVPDDGRSWRVGKPAKSPSSKLAVMNAFATPARAPSTLATDALAAAVRSGRFLEMPRMLDAAFHRASLMYKDDPQALKAEATQHLLSTLRACATIHRHREALGIFSHMASRIDRDCINVWSLLLYNAIEAGAFDWCAECVDKLSATGALSSYDLVNIVRYHAHWHDISGLQQLIKQQDALGTKIDAITRNRALAACVTEGALEVAETLLLTGNVWRETLDTVGYNTLIKGYSRAGQVSKCFALHAQMKAHGQQSSEVTFGILLDACISSRDLNSARSVFQDLRNSGLRMNAVHFTTFIKGLVAAGDFLEADVVLQDMLSSPHTEPDLITYSTLVKAYADRGQVESAVGILKQMLSRHVEPDEVIFNSLLNGCVCRSSPMSSSEVFAVFDQLIACGLKPSAATLSILLKSLVRGEAWEEALQLLREVPVRFKMETEPRLYAQLAQACITAGRGSSLQQVYKTFLASAGARNPQISENINGRLLKQCIRCAKPEFASMLLDAALQVGSCVEPRIAVMVRDAAQRRGKPRPGFTRNFYD